MDWLNADGGSSEPEQHDYHGDDRSQKKERPERVLEAEANLDPLKSSESGWSAVHLGEARTHLAAVRATDGRDAAGDSGGSGGGGGKGTVELRPLPYDIASASYSCPDGPAAAVAAWDRRRGWKAGAGKRWLILRLRSKSLLSYIRIWNGNAHSIDIGISVAGLRKRDFVSVKAGLRLALGRTATVPIGHLPCVYVRLECGDGGDAHTAGGGGSGSGACLHAVQLVGLDCDGLDGIVGPAMDKLIHRSTEELLFGPSLAASLPAVSSARATRALARPATYYGGDFDRPFDAYAEADGAEDMWLLQSLRPRS